MRKERSMWIDCFRAITICLVVIGHITGEFNGYIYQFHMAAFFWLAGFCTNWSRCSKKQLIWERFFSLMLPTIVLFLVGTLGMWALDITNMYSFFWGEMAYIGVKSMLHQFFVYGNNYVWWMGATWFLVSLFQIVILHAFLLYCIGIEKKWQRVLYGVISISIYAFGVHYVHTVGGVGRIGMPAIGQLYFGMGVLCKSSRINKKLSQSLNGTLLIVGIFMTAVIMKLFSYIKDIGVDYPSGKFEHILLNVLAAFNGILLVFLISKLLEKLFKNNRYIEKTVNYIGGNTIGVVFFHFLMFKVCIGILILFGVVDASYMQNFIPIQNDIGLRYLWIFAPIAIVGSICIWRICNLTYWGRVILGSESGLYRKWYTFLANTQYAIKIKNLCLSFAENMRRGIKKYWSMWLSCPKYEKLIIIFLFLMYIADGVLIVQQGIILNDELILHLKRLDGFKTAINYLINNELRMKRPLRILSAINSGITFCFENIFLNKLVMVLLIGIALLAFATLIIELFERRNIAYISIGIFLVFVPLVYEHGAPNAFIGLVTIPFVELCMALIFWHKYLKTDKKNNMCLGILFWILALGGYEFVVTYTPAFVLLYFWGRDKKKKSFHDFVWKVFLPVGCGVIYFVLTFIFQKMLGVGYEGTVMNLTAFSDIWNVEKLLFLSSLPGYFLFNRKYVYLTCFYSYTNRESIVDIIARLGLPMDNFWGIIGNTNEMVREALKEILQIIIRKGMSLGIILLLTAVGGLFYFAFQSTNLKKQCACKEKEQRETCSKNLMVIWSLIVYMFLPQMPNAVSKMYQETVTEDFFIWLPVSIFLFFTACLCLGYILNLCLERWQKSVLLFLGCFFILFGVPVQYMNKITSDTNHKDFDRLLKIEALFQTECMKRLERATIYAPDLFETKNLLAVNAGYWSEFSMIEGSNIKIIDMKQKESAIDFQINMVEDSYFCIVGKEEIAVLSEKKLPDYFMVKLDDDKYEVFNAAIDCYDNGFYCYSYEWKEGKAIPLEGKIIFDDFRYSVGTSLADAEIIGRYEDGWCKKETMLRINSGEDGKLIFEGYCPLDLTDAGDHNIIIEHDNEKLVEYHVIDEIIYFEVLVEKDTEYTLKLISDFLIKSDNGDDREMSYILTNVY